MTKQIYFVRDDSALCTTHDCKSYVQQFIKLLQSYMSGIEVRLIDVKEQNNYVAKWIKDNYPPYHYVISLDKWFKGDYQLNVSRVFEANSKQERPLYCRIGSMSMETPIADIPNDRSLILVDDDIASGYTIRVVLNRLKKYNLCIPNTLSMADIYLKDEDVNVYDFVDMRDFIPNALYGGLLTWNNEKYKREMYIHPHVNLCTRMKFDNEQHAINFSNELEDLIKKEFNYVC